jgi:prevent-host-death family protein
MRLRCAVYWLALGPARLDNMTIAGHHIVMTQVGVAELKANLSSFLRRVRRGESVTVLDRDTPVARIVPVKSDNGLEITPAKEPSSDFFKVPPADAPPPKIDIVELLLEDRARR